MASDQFSLFGWKKPEVIFTLSVLLILFGVSFFQLRTGEMKTRDAQRKADVELVARALHRFYEDHDFYPASNDNGEIISCGLLIDLPCQWGVDPISDAEGVLYIKQLPQEPFSNSGRKYIYTMDPHTNKFKIYVALEHMRDVDLKKDLTVQCGTNVQCNWYVEN